MAWPDAAEQAAVARRRTRAIELRTGGATWQQIADELEYASRGAACTDVVRALELDRAALAETVDAHRQLELERLDRLIRAATAVLDRRHVVVSHGRIVCDDAGPLLDDGPVLAAVDRLQRLSESRRRLLGLDAPAKTEFSSGPGDTFVGFINIGSESS